MSERIDEGEAERLARREPVSFRRLTREEYANSVRDLLGVTFDVADPTGLTENDLWHGFERLGPVLSLSPSHIEKYLAAAEEILSEAYPEKAPVPIQVRKRALDLRGGPSKEKIAELEAAGLAEKVRVDLWPGHNISGSRPGPGNLKSPGDYRVRIRLSGLQPPGGPPPHLSFRADKLDRVLFEQDIVAPEDQPTTVEFITHLPAGGHSFVLTNDVPGPSILPRSGRAGRKPFFSIAEGRIPWQTKLTDEQGVPILPFLIVDWVEWEGPLSDETTLAKRSKYFPTSPDPTTIREALHAFASDAFRRPATEEEVEKFAELVESEFAIAEDFPTAMKTGMLAVLSSKSFLYLIEDGRPDDPNRLDDHELASRLSYFLWSTAPDAELRDLAARGVLRERENLLAQTRRLLADPRSQRFTETFPREWLQLQRVGQFAPDPKLYPDYDPYLEASMTGETTAFFNEVLRKNLGLGEFLQSDWTMLNPRLARHYGMPPLEDDRFRRVSLHPDHHRGGILTHASTLSLTSDGTRHRPVHRGAWVLESVFGKSPPPPPANVEPIAPTPPDSGKTSVRQKIEAHISDPNCASCHAKFDPLGFAFENYDAIGRYRETEISALGKGQAPPLDASGTLADGREFANSVEFRQLLLADIDRFARTFIEKLATYALRRTMSIDDRKALTSLTKESAQSDHRLNDLLEAFITSDLFQSR